MEYEIDDDPQGLPDIPDGDRDGGLREDLIAARKAAREELDEDDRRREPQMA